jgi:lipid-A-disaccharide synthase
VPLLSDTSERARQVEAFGRLDQIMAVDAAPSVKAGAIVVEVARAGRRDLAAVQRR